MNMASEIHFPISLNPITINAVDVFLQGRKMPPQKQSHLTPSAPYWALILVVFLYSCWMSLNNFISHSEFWPMSLSKLFGELSSESLSLYQKPLFHAILSTLHWLPLNNGQHILASRLLFGLLGGLNFFLVLHFVKNLTQSYRTGTLYGLFLISLHTYSYSLFRVRADSLSLFFVLLILNWSLVYKKTRFTFSQFSWINGILILGLTLSSMKSLYFIFSLPVFFCSYFKDLSLRKKIELHIKSFSPMAFCGLILVFISSASSQYSSSIIHQAIEHVQSSQHLLFTKEGWAPFIKSIEINFFNFILLVFCFFYGFLTLKQNRTKSWISIYLFSATLLLCLLLHSQKWDFFLAAFYPLLFLPILSMIPRIISPTLSIGFVVLLFSIPAYMTHFNPWYFSNAEQIKQVKSLETSLQPFPEVRHFDGVGILPKSSQIYHFLGPYDPKAIAWAIKQVQSKKPEFIFHTTKMKLARPEILVELNSNYEEIRKNIWIRKTYIHKKKDLISTAAITDLKDVFFYDYTIISRHFLF